MIFSLIKEKKYKKLKIIPKKLELHPSVIYPY